MISVVMATYNGEKYIEKQLESILNQSLIPDEVIIRDDGSSDATVQLVKDFIQKNKLSTWNIEVNDKNLGYKKNFANLLSLAKGDYIFLSDQDDEWISDKIDKMVTILKDNKAIQALNGGVRLIDANSNKVEIVNRKNVYNANFYFSKKTVVRLNKVPLASLIISNVTPGCAMAITKELRDTFISSYEGTFPHDWYLNMLAAYNGGCYFLNEEVISYRIHENNASSPTAAMGILSKLQKFNQEKKRRVERMQSQVAIVPNIEKSLGKINSESSMAYNFVKARLAFYERPNLRNLIAMRKYDDYKDRTVLKGEIWDLILAFKVDKLIYLFGNINGE